MYYIGIDVGGMSIKVGVVDAGGNIVKSSTFVTEKVPASEHIKKMAETVDELMTSGGFKKEEIAGIGVGIPGAVNPRVGKVIYAPNIGWKDVDFCKQLSDLTGMKVFVGNDADVATLGEVYFGVAKNYSNVVMITVGTGVGGGVVIDKKLYESPLGMAAELGHTCLVKGGLLCGCGRKGCFEQYASATALIRQTKDEMLKNESSYMWKLVDGDIEKVNGITSFKAAKAGDEGGNNVVDGYVSYLTEGILNYMNIFRPEAIIIGGGISKEGDYLTDKIKAYAESYSYGYPGSPVIDVVCAKLGNAAGIVGAASLVVSAVK